jgi:alanine dehydrogenase
MILELSLKRLGYLDDVFGSRIYVGAGGDGQEHAPWHGLRGRVVCPLTRAAALPPAAPLHHSDPVYVQHGVINYGATNILGAVTCTSTFALTDVNLPYLLKLAQGGEQGASR